MLYGRKKGWYKFYSKSKHGCDNIEQSSAGMVGFERRFRIIETRQTEVKKPMALVTPIPRGENADRYRNYPRKSTENQENVPPRPALRRLDNIRIVTPPGSPDGSLPRGHISCSVDLKIGQNICCDEILEEFEFRSPEVKN